MGHSAWARTAGMSRFARSQVTLIPPEYFAMSWEDQADDLGFEGMVLLDPVTNAQGPWAWPTQLGSDRLQGMGRDTPPGLSCW